MKKLFIILTISVGLFARLNPFEPVIQQPLQPHKQIHIRSKDDGNRTVKIQSTSIEDKPKVIVKIKEKVIKEVVKPKITKEELIKECKLLEKEQNIKTKITKAPNKKTVKNNHKTKRNKKATTKKSNKKRDNFVKTIYKILPFLNIDSNQDNIVIKTTQQHKIIKYFLNQSARKFVFDIKADVTLYTKRKQFDSKYFKSYIVGNHSEENFVRVVIITKQSTNHYKVNIKNNFATIKFNK